MMGIIGIILALRLLIYLAYRGVSVLILAPSMAVIAVLLSGDPRNLASYTQIFMQAAGDFIVLYFPLFLLGAIFGKLMDASGSASTIAHWIVGSLCRERAIPAVVLSAVISFGNYNMAATRPRKLELH